MCELLYQDSHVQVTSFRSPRHQSEEEQPAPRELTHVRIYVQCEFLDSFLLDTCFVAIGIVRVCDLQFSQVTGD